MTNKFLSKGTTLQSEPGPLASVDYVSPDEGIGTRPRNVPPRSSIRAISQSGLSEEPDSLIKEPDFKIMYKFLIKDKGQNLIK